MDEKKNSGDLFQHGQDDIEAMKVNLAKLYNLSDEEKSEQALLQSRIEEQSNLIMMLKKRADEYLIRSQSLEKNNNEWENKVKVLEENSKRDEKKYRVTQHNYNKLTTNYEEIRAQYDGMRTINERLEASRLALEKEVADLQSHIMVNEESKNVRSSLNQMEVKNKELERIIKTLNGKYSDKIQNNEREIKIKQEVIDSMNETIQKMKSDSKNAQSASLQSTENIRIENESLKKELNEIHKNVDQLTVTVRKKNDEISQLSKKSKDNENKYLQMKDKYDREAESINVSVQLNALKSELSEEERKRKALRQEYEAYKVHSNKLLQTEKELCARLRKLYS